VSESFAAGDLKRLPLDPPVLYLVRHAKAGSRYRFDGPDSERPLTAKGLEQARQLAVLLDSSPRALRRALSSPAARCVQTIEPIARSFGVGVEAADWLSEGEDPVPAFAELCRIAQIADSPDGTGGPIAACTHGDIMWGVLDRLARDGIDIGEQPDSPKGCMWVIRLGPEREAADQATGAWLLCPEELG